MRLLPLALLLSALLILPACAAQRRAEFDAARASEAPPADFWLSVAVLRAPADTASRAAAYLRAPAAVRPARYIIEANRILRVAVGSGAREETFPPQTRQLTAEQFADVWNTLRESSLIDPDHPAATGAAPAPETLGERTVYLVSFTAGGDRRVLVMDAAPDQGPGAEEAKVLVEKLAGLAWME